MLRHAPVRQRDLLGADRVRDAAHLARVVAEPVVDLVERDDLVVRHSVTLLLSASIEHLASATRNRLVLVACILGSVIVFVDSTVVNVALPAIQRDLGGGLALQQWVVDAYLLTLGSLILVGGSLGDLFGARRLFLIGIVTFGVMSIACAAAPDGTTLIVARALQGVAGAILTPAGLAVIAATFTRRGRAAPRSAPGRRGRASRS